MFIRSINTRPRNGVTFEKNEQKKTNFFRQSRHTMRFPLSAQKLIDTFDETDFNGHGLIQNRHPRAEESFRRDVGEFNLFSHIYFK